MFNRKYFLDLSDLQFKQVRLPWKSKLIRFIIWSTACIGITIIYTAIFNSRFGSSRERMLSQEIENLKLKYSIMGMQTDNSLNILNDLRLSDDAIKDIETIHEAHHGPFPGNHARYVLRSTVEIISRSDLLERVAA